MHGLNSSDETATPQCKRILNRYFGKCMFGKAGGARFQQMGQMLLSSNSAAAARAAQSGEANQAAEEGAGGEKTGRGGDGAAGRPGWHEGGPGTPQRDMAQSLDFAQSIVDAGV